MAYFIDMAQTNGAAAVTAIAMNTPAHQAGDLLVAYITVDSGTVTITTGTWTALPLAPANPVSNGTITYLLYRLATSSNDLLSITTADAYTCGVYCFRDVDQTTPFDGVTPINQSAGAAAVTVTCSSVTTQTANALVVYMCAFDGTTPQVLSNPGVMWIDGFDSTGTTATTSSHQAAAWYITRTASASPTATFLCNASNASTRVTFAIRNASGGRVPAYIDDVISPGTMITPAHHTAAVNNVTFTATLTNTSAVNGKTVAASTPTLGADFGINPYANAVGRTAAITAATSLNGYEITLTGGRNFSTGLVMGSLIALNPKSGTFGLGSIAQGGIVARIGSAAGNWCAYQIAAKNTSVTTENRYVFAIEPGYTTTSYGTPGSAVNTSAVTYMQILMNCPAFAANAYLSELHQVFTQVIAGGDANFPVDADGLAVVGKSFRLPVIQKVGSAVLSFAPIQIGGGDAVNFQIDAGALQFPRRYNAAAKEIAYHASDNKVGISFAGKSGDVIKLTNSVVTSPTTYYWEINAAATSAATWDFTGLTVVNATTTLRNVMTFDSMSFNNCPIITASGCTVTNSSIKTLATTANSFVLNASSVIQNCDINTTGITAGVAMSQVTTPSVFSGCTFTGSSSTGHAIEITTAGTYTFSGNVFSGYGAGGTNSAAIYNNSGGLVTINVTSGGSGAAQLTVRNGAGASTTINANVQITLTGLQNPSEVRVFLAGTTTEVSGTGNESVTTGSHAFSVSSGTSVDITILSLGYQNTRIKAFSTTADTSVPVSQVLDRQYQNI